MFENFRELFLYRLNSTLYEDCYLILLINKQIREMFDQFFRDEILVMDILQFQVIFPSMHRSLVYEGYIHFLVNDEFCYLIHHRVLEFDHEYNSALMMESLENEQLHMRFLDHER